MAGRLNKKKINAKNVICGIFQNSNCGWELAAGPGAFQPTEMFPSSLFGWMDMCRMDGDARIQYNPAISAVCSSLC
jgi:hypothetical protein